MLGRLLRIAALCAFLGPSFAHAGYGWGGYCWDSLEVAMGVHTAWYNTAAAGAKILMFNPGSQRVYYIQGTDVLFVDAVYSCNSQGLSDYGTTHMTWYAPSAGVLIAGSSTGNSSDSGASSSGSVSLIGWSMTAEQGAQIGVAVAGLFAVAAVFRVLTRVGNDSDEE